MNHEVDLREATTVDVEDIIRVFRAARRINLPYLPELHTQEEDLEYFTGQVNNQTAIVSEDDSKVVGFCIYNRNWLNHLYIIPEYQHIGIGTLLLDRAKNSSDELNLWVFQKNSNAIAFYKKNGFELVKTTKGSGNEEHEPDAWYVWHK